MLDFDFSTIIKTGLCIPPGILNLIQFIMLKQTWIINGQVHNLKKEKREDCIQIWYQENSEKELCFPNKQKYTQRHGRNKKQNKKKRRKLQMKIQMFAHPVAIK